MYFFRAWHEYGESARPAKPGMIYDEMPGDCLLWKNQNQKIIKIMQSTGREDVIGKKIYEDDIVIGKAIADCDLEEIVFKGIVKYDFDECCYYVENYEYIWPYISFRFIKEIKVIGNIYEGEIYK
jgi:hypothetical protein